MHDFLIALCRALMHYLSVAFRQAEDETAPIRDYRGDCARKDGVRQMFLS